MANAITVGIENDPAELAATALEYLENSIPGWTGAPGGLDTLIVEALSEEAALAVDVASGVADDVFRAFGPIAGVPSLEAVAATTVVTFTTDTAGRTIPANTTVGLRDDDATLWAFSVPADTLVAGTSLAIEVQALEEGAASSGLSGTVEIITAPAFVTGVAVSSPSSGGADPEPDDVFGSRLAETLTLSSPRPILPGDFALLARTIPGVYRATGIDLLKPSSGSGAVPTPAGAETTGNARTVTVAVTDVSGLATGSPVRTAVANYLTSEREINFLVYVVDALYQAIAVTVTVKVWPGNDLATVAAEVQAAIRAFLSPSAWGGGPTDDPAVWLDEPVLTVGMLYEVIGAVPSVRKVNSLTFGPSGGSMGTADITLAGSSARPALTTTVAGTVAGTGINVTAVA